MGLRNSAGVLLFAVCSCSAPASTTCRHGPETHVDIIRSDTAPTVHVSEIEVCADTCFKLSKSCGVIAGKPSGFDCVAGEQWISLSFLASKSFSNVRLRLWNWDGGLEYEQTQYVSVVRDGHCGSANASFFANYVFDTGPASDAGAD